MINDVWRARFGLPLSIAPCYPNEINEVDEPSYDPEWELIILRKEMFQWMIHKSWEFDVSMDLNYTVLMVIINSDRLIGFVKHPMFKIVVRQILSMVVIYPCSLSKDLFC